MTDEERIFQAAVEVAAPGERADLLRQLCGDNRRLRKCVEALLRHHDAAGDFLETPPSGLDWAALRASETHNGCGDDSVDLPRGVHRASQQAMFEPPDRPGLLGRLDHYEILDVHGSGGMAVVFRAYDPKLARQVAIKMLAPELAERPAAGERFLREARAMALVRHPHVVTIHGIEDRGPLPYLVMEFVQGITLQERIDARQPFDLAETLRIGQQIAEGLAAAHALGLVHRDIKPANILLEGDRGQVKIADFGLAQAAREAGGELSREIVGTPQYMPPEQARGEVPDQRGDLFSLGGVL
ncbi:MAG: serine/threonine protein kinase, partial [Pirellulaceae bacterium]|nr:serine/threonine protein kinase [Pirellulaceae bacterium]